MIPQNKSSKTQINVNEESMQKLMQETYNEIVDERNKALILYKRVTKDIDSNSDIALIGKVANDLLKIMDGAVEKKLKLIKCKLSLI